MKKANKYLAILFCFLLAACSSAKSGARKGSTVVSPYDFGLSKAKSGVERYDVLLRTHQAAVTQGVDVSYRGIKTIELEIPPGAERIPLTRHNDFNGCTFVIKNVQKTVYLFEAKETSLPISISKSSIDKGRFEEYPELSQGKHLLWIEDANPWVENRKGFSYGHQRKDILLVEEGMARNAVVMPYDNKESAPNCRYINADNSDIDIKNLTICRTENSSAITNIFFISGKNGVLLSNFSLHTPENDGRNDRAIRIDDCTKCTVGKCDNRWYILFPRTLRLWD